MKKIVIYTDGATYYMEEGVSMQPVGGVVKREIDVTNATPDEIEQIKGNSLNDTFLNQVEQKLGM